MYNKNVTYICFAYKNTQNISIRSQLLTRWTTFLGHLPKRLYFDAESVTNGIQNWSIMKIMMHYCMLNERSVFLHSLNHDWSVSYLICHDPLQYGHSCSMTSQFVIILWHISMIFNETWDEKLAWNSITQFISLLLLILLLL